MDTSIYVPDVYGLTDRGNVRSRNEDQFLIAKLEKSMVLQQTSLTDEVRARLFGGTGGHLFVVADGLGGAAGGERASRLVVDTITRYIFSVIPWFFGLNNRYENDLLDELKMAIEGCQQRVRAAGDSQTPHMGTTLTIAYVLWPRIYVVHAGDSRCYLLRESRLEQITRDHTLAQRLVDEGSLDANDARYSRWSHVLWNAIGGDSDTVEPEVYKGELAGGDTIMLCSDGLSGQLTSDDIRTILASATSAESACRRLVTDAKEAGGRDNITAVVARFDQPIRAGTGLTGVFKPASFEDTRIL